MMIADVEEEKVKATSWSEEKREDDHRESPREGREGSREVQPNRCEKSALLARSITSHSEG